MGDFKTQAQQQYDPQYNAKVTALKNSLANQLGTLDQSKAGVNTNYDNQVGLQNLTNTRNKNNLSNTALGRGMARSSIVTSNLGEADQINTRQVGQINTARTGALNNIEQQKALLNNNTTNTLTTMAGDRESQIAELARQLENADYQRNFQERQFNAEQGYKAQQLALQREQMAQSKADSFNPSMGGDFMNAVGNIDGALEGINGAQAKMDFLNKEYMTWASRPGKEAQAFANELKQRIPALQQQIKQQQEYNSNPSNRYVGLENSPMARINTQTISSNPLKNAYSRITDLFGRMNK